MLYHLLITLVLASFSIAAHASAIPTDAGNAASGAIQNTDLYKDVVSAGGHVDKDVAEIPLSEASLTDQNALVQTSVPNGTMLADQDSSALQPLLVALMIIALIVFVLSRKSISTK